jgi:hypothetical protein
VTSLFARSFSQLSAADASGKTEVILDLGAGSRLSPDREALNDDGFQPLRRTIDGGTKPCGSRAIDGKIIFSPGRIVEQP